MRLRNARCSTALSSTTGHQATNDLQQGLRFRICPKRPAYSTANTELTKIAFITSFHSSRRITQSSGPPTAAAVGCSLFRSASGEWRASFALVPVDPLAPNRGDATDAPAAAAVVSGPTTFNQRQLHLKAPANRQEHATQQKPAPPSFRRTTSARQVANTKSIAVLSWLGRSFVVMQEDRDSSASFLLLFPPSPYVESAPPQLTRSPRPPHSR